MGSGGVGGGEWGRERVRREKVESGRVETLKDRMKTVKPNRRIVISRRVSIAY